MKRTLTFLFLLAVVSVAEAESAPRLLGMVKDQQLLFDGDSSIRKSVFFQFTEGVPRQITVLLPSLVNVTGCTLWFAEKGAPKNIELQTSQDLFQWTRSGNVSLISAGAGRKKAVFNTVGVAALFVRFVVADRNVQAFRLSEIRIVTGRPSALNRLTIKPAERDDESLTLILQGDADFSGSLRYGSALDHLQEGPMMAAVNREHRITISGLERGTDYYILGIGRDLEGRLRYAGPIKVRTTGIPRPKFTDISVRSIAAQTADLECRANKEVSLRVVLRSKRGIEFQGESANAGKVHKMAFSGLAPETEYSAELEIRDAEGEHVASAFAFSTRVENVAKTAVITGDFHLIGESIAPVDTEGSERRLVDGDCSYLNGSVMCLENLSAPRAFTMDLGRDFDLQRVDLLWWELAYASSTRLEVSGDGSSWHEISQAGSPNPSLQPDLFVDIPHVMTSIPVNVRTRWIRCIFPKGCGVFRFPQYGNIRLLEVWAVPKAGSAGPVRAAFEASSK